MSIFANAPNEAVFDKKIDASTYYEMLDFYKKTLVGAAEQKSKTGRAQLVKWG